MKMKNRWGTFVSLVFVFLAGSTVEAFDSCQTLFAHGKAGLGPWGVNAALLEPYYRSQVREFEVVSAHQGQLKYLVQDQFQLNSDRHIVVTSKLMPEALSGVKGATAFADLVKRTSEFVDAVYAERRRDWDPELRAQLRQEALDYADQSEWIQVYEVALDRVGPSENLVASMRLVRAQAKDVMTNLPMEKDFQILLTANAGRKFEPANLVIARSAPREILGEIFVQWIRHAHEQLKHPGHVADQAIYFTPVDPAGEAMYAMLGFHALKEFPQPVWERGKAWKVWGASAEDIANLPERILNGKGRMSLKNQGWMGSIVDAFAKQLGNGGEITGWKTQDIVNHGTSLVPDVAYFLSEPFDFMDRKTGEPVPSRRFSLGSYRGPDIDLAIAIPLRELPLAEGWQVSLPGFGKYGPTTYRYHQGVLTIDSPLLRIYTEIEVPADLSGPRRILYRSRAIDFTARFGEAPGSRP